jgi:hypothetical protein
MNRGVGVLHMIFGVAELCAVPVIIADENQVASSADKAPSLTAL